MAFTASDIDLLERAIAEGRGARTIAFSDQSVTFNSIADMLALLAQMRREVAATTTTGNPSGTRYASVSKGL